MECDILMYDGTYHIPAKLTDEHGPFLGELVVTERLGSELLGPPSGIVYRVGHAKVEHIICDSIVMAEAAAKAGFPVNGRRVSS